MLTAFLGQTYQLLQPDGSLTTDQLLAYGFSSQRATNPISPSLNDTMNSLLSPTPFAPPNSARWINSLFFVSLVLSLAAALFAIMAKQWVREYKQWNSSLASPRENILVRQIRVEAWDKSNITVILAGIPILLELAMILFLAGVDQLLWTLDNVVAMTVTACISAFLALFSILTILPLVRRQSPYKSPTAWMLLLAWHVTSSTPNYCVRSIKMYIQLLRDNWDGIFKLGRESIPSHIWMMLRGYKGRRRVKWPERLQSWRDHDLASCRITKLPAAHWWKRGRDVRDLVRGELAREQTELRSDGSLPFGSTSKHIPDHLVHASLVDLSETPRLLRALAWVQRASQDVRSKSNIQLCMRTIHPVHLASPSLNEGERSNVHMVTTYCILASLAQKHDLNPEFSLLPIQNFDAPSAATAIRSKIGCRVLEGEPSTVAIPTTRPECIVVPAHLYVLFNDLLTQLQEFTTLNNVSVSPRSNIGAVRRILDITVVLTLLESWDQSLSDINAVQATGICLGLAALKECIATGCIRDIPPWAWGHFSHNLASRIFNKRGPIITADDIPSTGLLSYTQLPFMAY